METTSWRNGQMKQHICCKLIYCSSQKHWNRLGPVQAMPKEFENAALFPQLGFSSTPIRHENGASRKSFPNRENLKTLALRLQVDGKHFENVLILHKEPSHPFRIRTLCFGGHFEFLIRARSAGRLLVWGLEPKLRKLLGACSEL